MTRKRRASTLIKEESWVFTENLFKKEKIIDPNNIYKLINKVSCLACYYTSNLEDFSSSKISNLTTHYRLKHKEINLEDIRLKRNKININFNFNTFKKLAINLLI